MSVRRSRRGRPGARACARPALPHHSVGPGSAPAVSTIFTRSFCVVASQTSTAAWRRRTVASVSPRRAATPYWARRDSGATATGRPRAVGVGQQLRAADRDPALIGKGRRENDLSEHARCDEHRDLRRPVAAQQAVDLLEGNSAPKETSAAKPGRSRPHPPRCHRDRKGRVQRNRKDRETCVAVGRASAMAGELGGSVERAGQVVGDQANRCHAASEAAIPAPTTVTLTPDPAAGRDPRDRHAYP